MSSVQVSVNEKSTAIEVTENKLRASNKLTYCAGSTTDGFATYVQSGQTQSNVKVVWEGQQTRRQDMVCLN